MKKAILLLYIFIGLASCKKDRVEAELMAPTEINVEESPTFIGGESIKGNWIDKPINLVFPPISSYTELLSDGGMYSSREPLFILRRDTIMFVAGYKGEFLNPTEGYGVSLTCREDESTKIINMINFLKEGYANNFMFQIWNGQEIISTPGRYAKNSMQLKSYSLYKTQKNGKTIPVVLLNLAFKVFDANDKNMFDGNIHFCYVPLGRTCE